MTASLSACFCRKGNASEIGKRDWPHSVKLMREPSNGAVVTSVNCAGIFPKLAGMVWPASLLRSGLGSKVSIWLGPPAIMRKITDFALAGKCGGFGARGLSAAAAADVSEIAD